MDLSTTLILVILLLMLVQISNVVSRVGALYNLLDERLPELPDEDEPM